MYTGEGGANETEAMRDVWNRLLLHPSYTLFVQWQWVAGLQSTFSPLHPLLPPPVTHELLYPLLYSVWSYPRRSSCACVGDVSGCACVCSNGDGLDVVGCGVGLQGTSFVFLSGCCNATDIPNMVGALLTIFPWGWDKGLGRAQGFLNTFTVHCF